MLGFKILSKNIHFKMKSLFQQKPHQTISTHHVYVCLVVVKSFYLKTVLSHVKSYFHTARQNNHANKLFQRNPVTAKSTKDVSQAEREAPTTS